MKYGTILRAVRVILVIVIVAMMVVPLVGSIASTNAKEMTAGIESKYDLEKVNDDALIGYNMIEVNLNQIDGIKNGFYVSYDNDTELKHYDDVSEAATDIIGMKTLEKSKYVTIYDSEKNVCHQSSIQYHDGINTTVVTGMKLPDNVMGMASFSISMKMVSAVADFDIPFGSSTIENGYLMIKTEIPDLLLILANSIKHDMEFRINVTIMGMASFYVNLDVDTDPTVKYEVDGHEITFTSGAAIGSYWVKVGDNAEYHYGIDGVVLGLTDGAPQEPLYKSITRDSNGNIPLKYKASVESEVKDGTISGEYYDDIVNILKVLEVGNHD